MGNTRYVDYLGESLFFTLPYLLNDIVYTLHKFSSGLYALIRKFVKGKVPRPVSNTDVLVDPPLKKLLFEDCDWQDFVRFCFLKLYMI